MVEEIWKPVEGYEGFYEVSNLGRVKSFHKNKEILLTPVTKPEGYQYIYLYMKKQRKLCYIHRLVALTFIPNNIASRNEVNHINGVKSDNKVSNLEWCSRGENETHAYKFGLKKPYDRNGEKNPNAKINDFQKEEIKELRDKGFLLKEISNIYGIGLSQISRIVNKNF